MSWWLLSGCLARQAPAYTWSWSPEAPRAEAPSPRQGKVLAVFAGDGGKPHPEGALSDAPCTPWNLDAVSLAIREELKGGGELFWLGDNVYPAQAKSDDGADCLSGGPWASGLAAVTRQADAGYRSRAHFIPGNHDYAQGSSNERVDAQAALIRELDAKPIGFWSDVSSVDLGPLVVVAYDTQYAMRVDPDGTLAALEREVTAAAEQGKRVALASHHPMFSVGPHGYQPWRGLFTDTDLANSRYQRWRDRLLPKLELWTAQNDVAISFAGHDHSLQLLQVDQGLYVTTGAGSKTSPVRGALGPRLRVHHAQSSLGYAVLIQDDAGALSVELVAVQPVEDPGCNPLADTGWYRCRVASMPF